MRNSYDGSSDGTAMLDNIAVPFYVCPLLMRNFQIEFSIISQ